MRTLKTLFTLTLAVFVMASCQSDSGSKDKTTSGTTDNATQPIIPPTTPPPAEPAQNADGVWHYTCPNGCEGGAGGGVVGGIMGCVALSVVPESILKCTDKYPVHL